MLGREVRPGVTTAELDRLAETFIRDHGGRPAFKGYRGFPATHLPVGERGGGPRDPGPAAPARRATWSGWTWAWSWTGYYGDSARTFAVGQASDGGAAADAGDARGPDGGDRAGPRREPGGGHLATRSRRTSSATASRSCARWWDTASAARCTRSRRCRTTGRPDAGPRLMIGQVLAIEPMVNAGGPDVVTQGRWLDGGDEGRQPERPLRAHGRGRAERPRDPLGGRSAV